MGTRVQMQANLTRSARRPTV